MINQLTVKFNFDVSLCVEIHTLNMLQIFLKKTTITKTSIRVTKIAQNQNLDSIQEQL